MTNSSIFLQVYKLFCLIGFLTALTEITTDDCNVMSGCFRFPGSCKNETCTVLFKWSDDVDSTQFTLIARMANIAQMDSAWLGIGFSKDQRMGDDNACICKISSGVSSIDQYSTASRLTPILLSQTAPNIGITNAKVGINNDFLICSFKRLKMIDTVNGYFDLTRNYYILAAAGSMFQNELQQHNLRLASSDAVNFNASLFNGDALVEKSIKPKVHGCLMVIVWIFLIPIAIVVARYYKALLPDIELFGVRFWFAVHFPSMISAFLLTIIALLIILSEHNWKWIPAAERHEFAHSVFGILAICFAFVQIVIAVFRCDKEHEYRYVFNNVHHTLGLTTYACALIAMFLGVTIKDMNLDSVGYGLLIGWVLWLIVVITSIELYEYASKHKQTAQITDNIVNKNLYPFNIQEVKPANTRDRGEVIRSILLVLHVFAALAFMLALAVTISIA